MCSACGSLAANGQAKDIQELCHELRLVHCVDPFQQLPVTEGAAYFRLHGRTGYRYRCTESDLKLLLKIIQRFNPCYVLFNNIPMLDDARAFVKLLGEKDDEGGLT